MDGECRMDEKQSVKPVAVILNGLCAIIWGYQYRKSKKNLNHL